MTALNVGNLTPPMSFVRNRCGIGITMTIFIYILLLMAVAYDGNE